MYKFQESEIKHGERLGNFHHVRQLRHAILTIYNGASYSKTPAYLLNKPVEELLREAGVTLRGKEFVLAAIPLKENIMTRAANWFGSTDQKQGEKTRIRVSQGKAPSKVPYPYIETSDGIDVDRDIRELLVNAFDLLRDHGATYTRVAEYLNSSDFPTATGGEWNKDTTRTFFQNPIHAGYFQSFAQKGGQAAKRGEIFLHKARFAHNPILSLDEWKECNPVMLKRNINIIQNIK